MSPLDLFMYIVMGILALPAALIVITIAGLAFLIGLTVVFKILDCLLWWARKRKMKREKAKERIINE